MNKKVTNQDLLEAAGKIADDALHICGGHDLSGFYFRPCEVSDLSILLKNLKNQ